MSKPDGALWSTTYTGAIWRISTAGQVTSYGGGINTYGIAAGPDGALWFANSIPNGSIGRMTTAGEVTSTYPGAGVNPFMIVAGPDGAMWFGQSRNSGIGRISTAVTPTAARFTPAFGIPQNG